MLCPAFTLIFNDLTNDTTGWKLAVTVTSAIAALLTAIIQFYRWQFYRWLDKWTMYHNTVEELKHVCTAFLVGCDNKGLRVKPEVSK